MRKVVMLPAAAQDLADIVEYLAQFYESIALRQYDRMVEKINELPKFPEKYEAYSAGKFFNKIGAPFNGYSLRGDQIERLQ